MMCTGLAVFFVTGIDETQTEDHITDYFEYNGSIKNLVRIPDNPALEQVTFNQRHVQKIQHFIRSDSTPSTYSRTRIRTFSGRLPRPNGEVEFDAGQNPIRSSSSRCVPF